MKKRFAGTTSVLARSRRGNIFSRAVFQLRGELRCAFADFAETALLAGAVALLAPLAASAQSNAVRARVTDRVDGWPPVSNSLRGIRIPWPRAIRPWRRPADLPMNRMMLVLKRSPEQEAALQDLLMSSRSARPPTFTNGSRPTSSASNLAPPTPTFRPSRPGWPLMVSSHQRLARPDHDRVFRYRFPGCRPRCTRHSPVRRERGSTGRTPTIPKFPRPSRRSFPASYPFIIFKRKPRPFDQAEPRR